MEHMQFRNQANLLRKVREDLGLTQQELATKLGLVGPGGTAFVSLVEMGKAGLPPERWVRLKKHVPMDDVLMVCVEDFSEKWVKDYERE